MPRGRAYRRHQRSKAIRKSRIIVRDIWKVKNLCAHPRDDEYIERLIRTMSKHRPLCSCDVCSPKRKYYGPTPQELRQPQMYEESE